MSSCIIVSTTILGKLLLPIINNFFDINFLITLDKSISKTKSLYFDLEKYYVSKKINVIKVKTINSKKIINIIKKNNIDYIFQLDWSEKFSNELINSPNKMCVGLHPSPLPKGRGAAILNWKIIFREYGNWGCSLFKMDNNFDSGPIIATQKFIIDKNDDIQTLYSKFYGASKIIFKNNSIKILNNNFTLKPNNFSKYKYYKRRTPDQSIISFSWSSERILCYYKALKHPFPNIYFKFLDNLKINISKVVLLNKNYDYPCGKIVKLLKNNYLVVVVRNKKAIKLQVSKRDYNILKVVYRKGISVNFKL